MTGTKLVHNAIRPVEHLTHVCIVQLGYNAAGLRKIFDPLDGAQDAFDYDGRVVIGRVADELFDGAQVAQRFI